MEDFTELKHWLESDPEVPAGLWYKRFKNLAHFLDWIGVPEQHHAVSHHRNDPTLIAKNAKIDAYHTSLFSISCRSYRLLRTATGRC